MSTHDTEIAKEQSHPESAVPPIHMQDTVEEQRVSPLQMSPSSPHGPRRNRWVLGIVSIVLVILLVALSIGIVLFAQQGQHPGTQGTPTPIPTTTAQPTATPTASTPIPLPVTGQWVSVLSGYKITTFSPEILRSAQDDNQVLYACAVPPGLSPELVGVQTVLRSVDSGKTWEDLAKNVQMSRGCELAVNPNNSNEVYVATSSAPATDPGVPSYVLKHTTDGGGSWETFQPTVHGPGLQITLNWSGDKLSVAGSRLYSLQTLPIPPMPTPEGHQGPLPTQWTRLLMSTDGGHTWGVLDSQFYRTWQSAWTYAIDPVNTNTIYELVGLPGAVAGQLPQAELYTSVDGGTTWRLLLKQIAAGGPIMPEMLIGSEKPTLVYLTNTRCPASQASQTNGGPLLQPLAGGTFGVCMSSDGGTTWRTLTAPAQLATSMYGGLIDPQGRLYTNATPTAGLAMGIWRYDPAADTWSKVTVVPEEGALLAVAPAGGNGQVALWFLGTAQEKWILYRYIE